VVVRVARVAEPDDAQGRSAGSERIRSPTCQFGTADLIITILVQSLAAGTANALILFVVGSALLFGKVMRGAMWVWVAAAVIAFAAGATTDFTDLLVWDSLRSCTRSCCSSAGGAADSAKTEAVPASQPDAGGG
jgi:hypothetical protein